MKRFDYPCFHSQIYIFVKDKISSRDYHSISSVILSVIKKLEEDAESKGRAFGGIRLRDAVSLLASQVFILELTAKKYISEPFCNLVLHSHDGCNRR